MKHLEHEDIEKEETLDDIEFQNFIDSNPTGLAIIPENYRDTSTLVSQPDSGDFAKWIRINNPNFKVDQRRSDKRLVLRSSDYWLPLVFLATDITLPIYLNLVSSYLFDKSKGLLKGETARVHLEVMFKDAKNGTNKKFSFVGDSETLIKIIKKIDINKLTDK